MSKATENQGERPEQPRSNARRMWGGYPYKEPKLLESSAKGSYSLVGKIVRTEARRVVLLEYGA